ncbi:MAG: glycosyltransferase family 2 protein [Candidatus Aenigmarchaeota archaeon]|nr:glycosyltransferase family 2 protein [Candidatus Aenigmarchaeota archaeon]
MTTIVLPASNEAKNIPELLESIPKKYKVVVVDDGSTDDTSELVKRLGYKCVSLGKNYGKGYACRIGAKHSDDIIIFMDSDQQMDASDIIKFEKAIKKYDIVAGVRNFSDIPLQRRIANIFARYMVNKITIQNFPDVLCGFRAVKKDVFMKLNLQKDEYEFESEMLIKAVEHNLKIGFINVSIDYTRGSRMKSGKSLKLAWYLLKYRFKN